MVYSKYFLEKLRKQVEYLKSEEFKKLNVEDQKEYYKILEGEYEERKGKY
ncbi:hypothetical protein [Priestia flexa]|nr:hypothetical protein [Priestia flexa]